MVYVRSVDGEPMYSSGRRRNHWPQTEYSNSDAGSEYYYDQDGGRRNRGRAAATRFNPYGYARGGYDTYGSRDRRPEVRTYTMSEPGGMERMRAASSRGYRQRYYEEDERFMMPRGRQGDPGMMDEPYLSRSTYPRFLVPGWGHILVGVFIMIMGVTDIGYTASEFGGDCAYTGSDFDPGPCEANHVYTYVASPVWGGIFMIMTGAVTFWMNPYKLRYNDWLLKAFCGLAVFLTLAICPAIIVLNILEITQNENTYWKEGDGITLQNEAKFGLPIVVVILAFVDWVLAIIAICICICCPPRDLVYEQKPKYMPGYFTNDYRREAPRREEPVVIHEEIIPGARRHEGARSAYSEDIIPRAAITAGPSHRERGPRIIHEEIIPGGSRRDDDVYTVYTDASQYSRGRRGRTNYGYARGDEYSRSNYY